MEHKETPKSITAMMGLAAVGGTHGSRTRGELDYYFFHKKENKVKLRAKYRAPQDR